MTDAGRARPTAPASTVGKEPIDGLDLVQQERGRKSQLLRLPVVARRALILVRRAAPGAFAGSVVLQVVSALALGVQVLLGREVLQALVELERDVGSPRDLLVPLVLLAVVGVVMTLAAAAHSQIQRLVNEQVLRETNAQLLQVTQAVPLLDFEASPFYDHLQRVEANAAQRPVVVARGVFDLISGLIGAAVLVVALVALDWLLVPLLALAAVPVFLTTRRASSLEFDFVLAQTPDYRRRRYVRSLLVERDTAKEVRAFDAGPRLRGEYDRLYDAFLAGLRQQVRRRIRLALVGNAASGLLTGAALLLLVQLLVNGRVSLADAAVAAVAMRLLAGRLSALLGGVGDLLESSLFLDDLDQFLARAPMSSQSSHDLPLPPLERLSCTSVGFTYPGQASPALQDVTFELSPGQVVALVGENGSGKTTLAKLLAGLYVPTDGSVLWNGRDYRDDLRRVRAQVAVIFQDFVRYKLTARDNIAMGRPEREPSTDALRTAARQARVQDVLEGLPQDYETLLSTEFAGGTDLSGGQWQRVALARAFFRDAPIVILDEPSAALDPRAEFELFQDLRQLLAGRTVVLVSHRFSSVRTADLILVLEQGRVVEQGDHESLMQREGLYAELFRMSAHGFVRE